MAERKNKSDSGRERHLAEVARLYVQGKHQSEIAIALQVTQQQVSYDLKVLQERWRTSVQRDYAALKEQEVAQIQLMRHELWSSWERSKLDKEVTFSEKNDTATGVLPVPSMQSEGEATFGRSKPPQVRTKSYIRREGQTGNASYMGELLKCSERWCKLLGLDAPAQLQATGNDAQIAAGIERVSEFLKNADRETRTVFIREYEEQQAATRQMEELLLSIGNMEPKQRQSGNDSETGPESEMDNPEPRV